MEEPDEQFYRIIRNKHPYTPIILWKILSLLARIMTREGWNFIEIECNASWNFEALRAKKKSIYILCIYWKDDWRSGRNVDAIHFTDLGMMRYVDVLIDIETRD